MEPIKITDKLTLRQEALRLSVATGTSYPVSKAQQFEAYLSGNADLPERDNGMEKYLQEMKDMLFKQHNSWLPVDGDIKPPHDADILGYEDGSMYFCKLTKVGDEDVFVINDGCEFHPTHWMPIPIPPFAQTLKQ